MTKTRGRRVIHSLHRWMRMSRSAAFLIATLLAASGVAAQDVITVGTVSTDGPSVQVPVYIRDVGGTPLGVDRPAGSKIQSFSIKVDYSPPSAVTSVTFTRAGITANLSPTFETSPSAAGSRSLLATFSEASSPIPFTLNRAAPGDLIAMLTFQIAASAAAGSSISLTLDSSLTQLTDEGGSAATKQTVAAGTLALVNGAININPLSVTLAPSTVNILRDTSESLTATTSRNVTSGTTLTVVSGNPSVASVPPSVVIAGGSRTATIPVTGVAAGSASITVTLPNNASAFSNVTVEEPPDPCAAPTAPNPSAPASAESGAVYNVNWNHVTNATEYLVEEATSATFENPSAFTVMTPSRAFSHTVTTDTRYHYRVRARNRFGSCDSASPFSSAVSVLVEAPFIPPPPRGVFPVVGSTPGQHGSFFKTSVQLYNPKDSAISGRIVYHAGGSSGDDDDPSFAYTLAPRRTLHIADLLPAMGESGLGSADLVADVGSSLPINTIRIFNDAGAAGTTGLAASALDPDDALKAGQTGAILVPASLDVLRLNVGIRTLGDGAAMTILVRDEDGNVVTTVSRSYPATYFEQATSRTLLDGYALKGSESISFQLTSGSAFIYGSATDNTTNDPSVQLAVRED